MKEFRFSTLFTKKLRKMKGENLSRTLTKIDDICFCSKTTQYKNLKHNFKKYKRVHVNNSFVILFFDKQNIIHFVDYAHHDTIYKHPKEKLKLYDTLFTKSSN